MAPFDDGDAGDALMTEPPPEVGPACWHCGEHHHSPFDIYRCDACGLALCKGEVFIYGRADGVGRVPLSHRPPRAGRRKGESRTGFCGPVSYLGECVDKTG